MPNASPAQADATRKTLDAHDLIANAVDPHVDPPREGPIQIAFEVFCAAIFLGMIGLVFYNAFLRYAFSDSYPPSEEWARFLFIYITFFGAIEAFIQHKHIAVDLLLNATSGGVRKGLTVLGSLFGLAALGLLLYGGVVNVLQTVDTYSVATNVNMALVNGTLPIMAAAAIVVELVALIKLLRRPASSFTKG